MATDIEIKAGPHNSLKLVGQFFGLLQVISKAPSKNKRSMWLCRCKCGNEVVRCGSDLKAFHTTSCGCRKATAAAAINLSHGRSKTRLHRIWLNMKRRCDTPSVTYFKYYGGRGIRVCERWLTFENFMADMGDPPTAKHQIDRIDNDGNYEPGNCRWTTAKENSRNRRSSRFIKANGVTKTLAEWAEMLHINHSTLHRRIEASGDADAVISAILKLKEHKHAS